MEELTNISFDLPKNQSNVIKVIGVGGGGSNAINHMFQQGIKGVDFIVCNTDSQALQNSPVPNKIQLGLSLTEGLGAGANPEVGQQSAIESVSDIEKMLDTNTKMIFITAGMGGGTGTGAAPVIAQLAKERNILTVGIVTIPFQFEGKVRTEQAMEGVNKLRKQVDSLIVINNNKLREVYGNLGYKSGFSKADEVLATAARGIAEVITHHYTQNIDLRDAKTVLSNSGTAIMGSSTASGDDRARKAISSALDSPLLNDNKIAGAKNVLLLIVSGTSEITIDEMGEINDYIQSEAGHSANIIMGIGEDDSLGDAVAVTIIATGFNIEQQAEIVNTEPKKIIHSLENEQKIEQELVSKSNSFSFPVTERPTNTQDPTASNAQKTINSTGIETPITTIQSQKIVYELQNEEVDFEIHEPAMDLVPISEFMKNLEVSFEIVSPQAETTYMETTHHTKEIEVITPEFVVAEQAFNFSLDLFEIPQTTKEIEVKDPINVIPFSEVSSQGIIKHSLEDYLEKEEKIERAQPVAKVLQPVDESLNFHLKEQQTTFEDAKDLDNSSPFEISLDQLNQARAEERKRKLKEFNYKFNTNSRVEEIEKEPAYKRMGLDVTTQPSQNNPSRTTLSTDSNNDSQLRSNNSYLHDNVD